jgi:hypothetical protein
MPSWILNQWQRHLTTPNPSDPRDTFLRNLAQSQGMTIVTFEITCHLDVEGYDPICICTIILISSRRESVPAFTLRLIRWSICSSFCARWLVKLTLVYQILNTMNLIWAFDIRARDFAECRVLLLSYSALSRRALSC